MNADARRATGRYGAADGTVIGPQPVATTPGRIERRTSAGPAPLSFAQERLWFLDQFQPGSAVYNVPLSLDLVGAIEIDALSRAVKELVARHESLRTTFALIDGQPMQIVAPYLDLQLPVIQCIGTSDAERREQARQLAAAEARRPFDLVRGPLIRASLFVIDPQRSLLLISIHHVVADASSAGILTREIAALYQAYYAGRSADLPLPPVQYADYAAWQRAWPQNQLLAKSLSYWKKQLAGSPNVLELPTDRPRSAQPSADGATFEFSLPRKLSERLRALAASEHATLFMVTFAVFITLLHRYSGQTDLVVGTPIANRNRLELEDVVGLFLNTLVLRNRVDDDPSFAQLLRRVRETCIEAYTHYDLPFEYLVQELQPDRNLGTSPLFQVLFVMQGAADPGRTQASRADAQATSESIPVGTGTAKFDLSLYLTDTGHDVLGAWEYRCELFDASTLGRMTTHFLALLEGALTDPDRRLSELPLLSEAEWHEMLLWNAAAGVAVEDACPHELFEAQAAASPDAPALIFDQQELSYSQLNRRANQLARRLRALGVGPEVPVGICVERSLEMVVGLLGILKAGGVHVPLDPAFPAERLAFMISDAGFPVLLTQGHLVSRLPADAAVTIVRLDADAGDDIAAERDDDLGRVVAPANLVYMLYTSGSTGRPKGAGLCQATMTSLIKWQNRITPMAPLARTLQFMSFSFDVSFIEIFSTLTMGGTLVLIREEVRQDVAALASLLQEHRVERAFFPFTALQQLAKHCGGAEAPELYLKDVISTGEPLVITEDVVAFFRGLGGCRLYNAYGPTETHWITCHTLPPVDSSTWPPLPPIGRCVDNAEIFILDNNLRPVPVGVPGDLYAGGLCLARYYHRRPALTAERFIPHPFSERPGERLYRTGDRARFRPDGTIEYLGRLDNQVKIRGFRVEVGEVEVTLGKHPDIEEAVVAARQLQGDDDKRLIAYVKLRPGAQPGVEALRGYLAQHLAGYMVPSIFVFVDEFPLGATGKIDRRRLPDPQTVRPDLQRVYVAPRSPMEEQLARIWADVLHIDKVGVEDSFFDLGGHSLLATQVVSRIRDALDVEVPVRVIFECPTIAALVSAVVERQIGSLDDAEAAALLLEIDRLSDDEVRSELADDAAR